MQPNERDIFKDAKDWQRCIDSGELSPQGVAQRYGYSKTEVSLTLKVGRLPTAEKNRYEEMYRDKRIVGAAIQKLSEIPDPEMRSKVLKRAIEICQAEDKRAKAQVRSSGQKGRPRTKGKVTMDDIRSAKRELERPA